jgi:prepilin-type N-terminal cleavage/methylation domain-containing protein
MKRNQSGFTLIEIAIVLVIIGLLLGGVLKGQELINSAKVKNLATDFRNIPVYIYGYQDKYKALPGDDVNVDLHLGGQCATTSCKATTPTGTQGNGLIDGNWNSTTVTDESYLFWEHVRLAGLTSGSTTPGASDYPAVNAVGGNIGIQSGTAVAGAAPIYSDTAKTLPIRGTYIICSPNILGKFAKQLDIQLDDGNTATGSMMAGTATAIGTPMVAAPLTGTGAIDDAGVYTVCMGV